MMGHGILKYFPILDKKDHPEENELYSIHLSHCRRLYQLSLITTELKLVYNAEVTEMPKHT